LTRTEDATKNSVGPEKETHQALFLAENLFTEPGRLFPHLRRKAKGISLTAESKILPKLPCALCRMPRASKWGMAIPGEGLAGWIQRRILEETMTLDDLCITTIRMLAADCVERAKSGHPGMPMGTAPMAYVLWTRFLKHNPSNPDWPDRDRFVLSAGHGSMLLYSLLHLTGYELPLEELKRFRQWGSLTPGHPESYITRGVETTTGPLGQGFANGVGMAIAERYLAARFNQPGHEIVDHYTYGIVSDGDLMEGVSHEAASLAGHLKLGKLIYFYDDNHISIDGSTDLAFTEKRRARFDAYGWHVQQVEDGTDIEAIEQALSAAQNESERPSFIAVRNHIGYGSPNKQDTASAHGEPLGPDEIKRTKEHLGWPLEPECFIPDEALKHFREAVARGKDWEAGWQERFESYRGAYPELAQEWEQWNQSNPGEDWSRDLPTFPEDSKGMATRVASGHVLNAIARNLPNLIGGSADLAPSNKTLIKGEDPFQAGRYSGRNFHFGVREHGMGSILNGMALHGGLIPYGGTFLIFSDYMRPAIRLASMMALKVIYIFTHDSIGLGEDGPTHQPIEQLAGLRAIPNLTVIRPSDANETAEAWRVALTHKKGPFALILTRQGLPTLDRQAFPPADGLSKGAYILRDVQQGRPDLILIASGSEVAIVLEAAEQLHHQGIAVRVVSMPSWELFEGQPEMYRQTVLPAEVKARIAVEAGATLGWHRYVGSLGEVIGLDHFGASAPYKTLYEKFGLTVSHVVEKALTLLGRH
jgi:transketolase